MAWRPHKQLIEGFLDNTTAGKVTGWLRFNGLDEKVVLDLEGNFHRDIRGAALKLRPTPPPAGCDGYMEGFNQLQTGSVGDITAGLEPADNVCYPYIEWYSATNGRVVIELDLSDIEVLGTPQPYEHEQPVDRASQDKNMDQFLRGVCESLASSAADELASEQVRPSASRNGVSSSPMFSLGHILINTEVGRLVSLREIEAALMRHERGDWGTIGKEDWEENELSLTHQHRLLSVYQSTSGETFWIITEADRQSTVVILPEEY